MIVTLFWGGGGGGNRSNPLTPWPCVCPCRRNGEGRGVVVVWEEGIEVVKGGMKVGEGGEVREGEEQ